MTAICQHCRHPKSVVSRPRGLCWGCYHIRRVRHLYPIRSVYAAEVHGSDPESNRGSTRPLPAGPTTARPGSEEKLAVLVARAAAQEQLWHPGDAALDAPVTMTGFS